MSTTQHSMANIPSTPLKDSIFPAKHVLPTVHANFQIISFLKTPKVFKGAQITLRFAATVATFTAMLVMLTSHQSTMILGMQLNARYSYAPAFKFFVFANAIACIFMLIALFFIIFFYRRGTCPSSCYYLFLNDMIMLTIVMAGCAAATAIGDMGLHGNAHTGWAPICAYFRKFCGRVAISLTFSYVSVVSLLILSCNFRNELQRDSCLRYQRRSYGDW